MAIILFQQKRIPCAGKVKTKGQPLTTPLRSQVTFALRWVKSDERVHGQDIGEGPRKLQLPLPEDAAANM